MFISAKSALVSRHFMFRFMPSTGYREQTAEKLCRPFALLFRCLCGREFLETRIIPQRIEHRIEPEQCGSERRKLSERFSI
jgi:hypothetical protein